MLLGPTGDPLGVVCLAPEASYGVSSDLIESYLHYVIAHEVGHNMGATHTNGVVYPNSLMNPGIYTDTGLEFVSPSINQISTQVSTYGSCLLDGTPGIDNPGDPPAPPPPDNGDGDSGGDSGGDSSGSSPGGDGDGRDRDLPNPSGVAVTLTKMKVKAKAGTSKASLIGNLNIDVNKAGCTIQIYGHSKKKIIAANVDHASSKAKLVAEYSTIGTELGINYSAKFKNGTCDEKGKVFFRAQMSCIDDGSIYLSGIKRAKAYGYGNSCSTKSVPKKAAKKLVAEAY